jgi:hypothetical protein
MSGGASAGSLLPPLMFSMPLVVLSRITLPRIECRSVDAPSMRTPSPALLAIVLPCPAAVPPIKLISGAVTPLSPECTKTPCQPLPSAAPLTVRPMKLP